MSGKDRVLKYLRTWDWEGYSPSIREICEGAGVKSTSNVYAILRELRKRGLYTFIDGKPRTIRPRKRG